MSNFCITAIPSDFKIDKILSLKEQMGMCDIWSKEYGVQVDISKVRKKFNELKTMGEISTSDSADYEIGYVYVMIIINLLKEVGMILHSTAIDSTMNVMVNILAHPCRARMDSIIKGKIP